MTTETHSVLIIDDESEVRQFLRVLLSSHGFNVTEADSGESGLNIFNNDKPDVIILDLGLPGMDGVETLRELRKLSDKPVLILSVRSQEEEKVRAFDSGADDYLTKPFGARELLARMNALLRRYHRQTVSDAIVSLGDTTINRTKAEVRRKDKEVKLTDTEWKLLNVFLDNPGRLLTHREILKTVWGGNFIEHVEYLRVYIGHLRQKIEPAPSSPQFLLTEPGIGYRFRSE